MTSIDIYSILQSKPHNSHHLKRYWNLILHCRNNPTSEGYTEEHHICPKAKDLFPEYENLIENPWNSIRLSTHRHVLAHLILSKAYGGSQLTAVHYFLNVQNSARNEKNQREIPKRITCRYAAKAREESYAQRKGTQVYKTTDGNIIGVLPTDHPKVLSGEYVQMITGHKMAEESKEIMRRAKDPYRKITLHFMIYERILYLTDPEFAVLIDYGWTPYMQQERYDLKEEKRLAGVARLTGKGYFSYPDGTFYGRVAYDDPIITELGLITTPKSEKQKAQSSEQAKRNAQNKEMQARKGKTLSTRKWFHDPITGENRRLIECPDGWKTGRSESENSIGGSTTWNDGIRNYRVKEGEVPEVHWTKGMVKRKKK